MPWMSLLFNAAMIAGRVTGKLQYSKCVFVQTTKEEFKSVLLCIWITQQWEVETRLLSIEHEQIEISLTVFIIKSAAGVPKETTVFIFISHFFVLPSVLFLWATLVLKLLSKRSSYLVWSVILFKDDHDAISAHCVQLQCTNPPSGLHALHVRVWFITRVIQPQQKGKHRCGCSDWPRWKPRWRGAGLLPQRGDAVTQPHVFFPTIASLVGLKNDQPNLGGLAGCLLFTLQ